MKFFVCSMDHFTILYKYSFGVWSHFIYLAHELARGKQNEIEYCIRMCYTHESIALNNGLLSCVKNYLCLHV